MMIRQVPEPVKHARLCDLVPSDPDWAIDWAAIWSLWPELQTLDNCPQDPIHHAEGDVGTHTRMVVEALVADRPWRALPVSEREIVFWAAVLHDIAKPAVTRHEDDGRITSRGHSRIGAQMARGFLWEAGSPYTWREALCGIIGVHQWPFWLIERPNPERQAILASWYCRPDHLCLHARADGLGRVCEDRQSIVDSVALARTVFEEIGCLDGPFPFANDESRVAFFEREDRDPRYTAYEDHRCTVTVMSGLPGSGKDTWIAANRPEHPVVSLDAIRDELDADRTGNQGQVIQAAYERAREHLRAREDFVWNGTNVTRQTRAKVLRLLRDYDARIEIVYLEPPADILYQRNRTRRHSLPSEAIKRLADKLEPPGEWEAHTVLRVTGSAHGQ
ncbi:MAG: AAA family ATPase [Pseudomonadota bacterium]